MKTVEERRKYLYGISECDYKKIYDNQNGLCAICVKNDELVVDHNHETGAVRGLLCRKCNFGLGLLKNSDNILFAMKYLNKLH